MEQKIFAIFHVFDRQMRGRGPVGVVLKPLLIPTAVQLNNYIFQTALPQNIANRGFLNIFCPWGHFRAK